MTKNDSTSSMRRGFKRSLVIALALASVTAAGCFFTTQAVSQTPGVQTAQVTSTKQTSQDPRTPPLDPVKIGDPMPRNLFVELSKLINPTVVSISTTTGLRSSRARYRDPLQEFLDEFWGGRGGPGLRQPQPRQAQALGTGFIIREDGLIITNNHVIESADVIKIQLDNNSDKLYEAKVIGRDARTDIALIKIEAKQPLPVARLGSSKDVQVGEWVAAFGNPYGHAHTMTKGIVSAIGREIAELNRFPFIQTDASINPGNSGGPLVNSLGYVIGVNTAIDARAQGIGFAIPIDNVKQIVAVLEKEGKIRRGFIGVGISPVTPDLASSLGMQEPKGVLITQIMRGAPADKAGLRPYDIIVEFGGKATNDLSQLQNAVADTEIGGKANAKIWRYDQNGNRKELSLSVTVSENPDDARVAKREPQKPSSGQTAPFSLGFKISDFSQRLLEDLNIPQETPPGPIVTEVERGSPAAIGGLRPGDVIADVNRTPVTRAADVIKLLKKDRNTLLISRGGDAILLIF